MPEPGPLGETFFEAKVLAIVLALFVNNLGGGSVESVFTFATHRFFLTAIKTSRHPLLTRALDDSDLIHDLSTSGK